MEKNQKNYNIMAYGAAADGQTNCREAIQKAIDHCNENGGGRVVVPAGKYLSGTIILKSNVDLQLENGAVLISSLNQEDIIDFARNKKKTKKKKKPNEDIGWDGGCFL